MELAAEVFGIRPTRPTLRLWHASFLINVSFTKNAILHLEMLKGALLKAGESRMVAIFGGAGSNVKKGMG